MNLQCQGVDEEGNPTSDAFEKGKRYEPSGGDSARKSVQLDELVFCGESTAEKSSFLNSYIESCELKQAPRPIYCYALETPYLTHLK